MPLGKGLDADGFEAVTRSLPHAAVALGEIPSVYSLDLLLGPPFDALCHAFVRLDDRTAGSRPLHPAVVGSGPGVQLGLLGSPLHDGVRPARLIPAVVAPNLAAAFPDGVRRWRRAQH